MELGLMMIKKCECCNKEFTFNSSYPRKRFCSSLCQRKMWVHNNKDRVYASRLQWRKRTGNYDRKYKEKLKEIIVREYGGCCVDCGEEDVVVLSIDHVYGNGKQHRIKLKKRGNSFYSWLRKNNYPKEEFELVCRNCNWRRWIARKNNAKNI